MGANLIDAEHQWKEIAVLTNGLCGSACSLFATKLQIQEGATVFSYGGDGTLMDTSAFAGGNVESYKAFWPQVFYAAIIGDILYGPDTPIGKRLRAPGAADRKYAKSLVLPMPTTAVSRFNFNMMYMKEFGDQSLPREWYKLPAHKHYFEWHPTSAEDASSWSSLQSVYTKIANEDWKQVRADFEVSKADYKCASEPPTEPFVKPEQPDRPTPPPEVDHEQVAGMVGLIATVIVCCCCLGLVAIIGCCIAMVVKGQGASSARQQPFPQAGVVAGTEMRAHP